MGKGDLKADLKQLASKYNVTQLAENWYVGGAIISRDMADQLELVGVTRVICAAGEQCEQDLKLLRKSDCDLYCLEWDNIEDEPVKPVEDFAACWAWVQAQIEDSITSGGCFPVFYVHCSAGLHRGPLLTVFLLAMLTGCTLERMIDYMYQRRPYVELDEIAGMRASARRAIAQLRGERVPSSARST